MIDPVRERQLQELDTVGICTRILYQARSELYVNMHFLDVSLSSLGFEADWGRNGISTDGAVIFYDPEFLLNLYKRAVYASTVPICIWCFTACSAICIQERGERRTCGIWPAILRWKR